MKYQAVSLASVLLPVRPQGSEYFKENRMLDAEIKRLMKSLGETINETLNDSPKINESIQHIRDAGYDVYLIIEAKIGFNRTNSKGENETISPPIKSDEPVRLRITSEDAKFLKSLKIAIDAES
jgi:hypothetical protein